MSLDPSLSKGGGRSQLRNALTPRQNRDGHSALKPGRVTLDAMTRDPFGTHHPEEKVRTRKDECGDGL